jgi:tetratricopeptide (TPR) repeat protein
MKHVLSRFSAACVAMLFLVAARAQPSAQTKPETSSAKPAIPEDLSQTELLKAYLQLREQLHSAQLAIVNNRIEAERAQTAVIAEKFESLRASLALEREREQAERARQQAERDRQQLETQRSNRVVLSIAVAFGAAGLLSVLLVPLFQVRALNRFRELVVRRPPQAGESTFALPGGEHPVPSDQQVTGANDRLVSAIDRMERRIMELEHIATAPAATAPARPANGAAASADVAAARPGTVKPGQDSEVVQWIAAAKDRASRIAVSMNRGRTFLASNRPLEAVACYDEILRLDPKQAEAMVRKGAALERLDRFEDAIECYERAIATDAKLTLAYLHKAAAYNRVGRYEDAATCFEQALAVEEKDTAPAFA